MYIFTNKHWLINLLTLIDSYTKIFDLTRLQDVTNKAFNIVK